MSIETDQRVQAVTTGVPTVQLLACVLCGVLLWDIDAHYEHSHEGCGHPNHGSRDHHCAPFKSEKEVRRWPTRAYGGTAMNGMRREDFTAGAVWAREQDTREPSDEEVIAALDALSRFNQWTENPRGAIRAALLAAQEVRHADNS